MKYQNWDNNEIPLQFHKIFFFITKWTSRRGQEQHVVVENGTERVEGGESESELDLLAEVETESDSDDQDNAESAQRSVQTGATQGSDAGKRIF